MNFCYNERSPESEPESKFSLILGLGNIGERYRLSRHNLGFMVVNKLLSAKALKLKRGAGEYDWASSGSPKIVFALPKTYMNRSGIAARALLQEYDQDPSRMLVVVDDFNLPLGKMRLRRSGSDGGHNGLASIIEELGTQEFPRLRLGIGPVPEGLDTVDFVLGDFQGGELDVVEKMINIACEAVMFAVEHSLDEAMSKYNVNPA